MRKQKPRNAFVTQDTNFTDLGVLNMTPVREIEQSESEPETNITNSEEYQTVRLEILEPKNWIRNRVIVRNP
jgi:hypothetical protein